MNLPPQFFSHYVMPATLAFIMFGMGMSLTKRDFANVVRHPRAAVLGLVLQLVVLPGLAFGIASASGLPPAFQVGVVLIAACPGGAMSNLLSHLLNVNLALSVSMTAVNSLITLLTIPVIIELALQAFTGHGQRIELEMTSTALEVLFVSLIPTMLGVTVRHYRAWLAKQSERPLRYIMPALLGLAMAGTFFLDESKGPPLRWQDAAAVLPWALMLNILGMALGFWGSQVFARSVRNSLTIAIEVGLQNTALAIAIATAPYLLDDQRMAIPAMWYMGFSLATAIAFGLTTKQFYKELREKRWNENETKRKAALKAQQEGAEATQNLANPPAQNGLGGHPHATNGPHLPKH